MQSDNQNKTNYYFCPCCNGITKRDSKSKRIKSYCDEENKDVFMIRIDSAEQLAKKLRRKYLHHGIDRMSFKPQERIFLDMAFEQGAMVVFNRLK